MGQLGFAQSRTSDIERLERHIRRLEEHWTGWAHEATMRLRTSDHLLHGIQRDLERFAARQKVEDKWHRRTRQQLAALLRYQYLVGQVPADLELLGRRFTLRSQNEEDGITLALLQRGGVTTRRFVEIGCGVKGGNSAVLAFDFGWAGLMVDANPVAIDKLRGFLGQRSSIAFVCATVTSRNVNEILRAHAMTGEIDVLSIDVDGTDYWILQAVDACTPRLLIIEYNALFGPERCVTIPDAPVPDPCPKGYSGASLAALEKLARRKGYRLVLCEPAGVNAFFLRNDVAPQIPGVTAAEAYRVWTDRRILEDEPTARSIDVYALAKERGLPIVSV